MALKKWNKKSCSKNSIMTLSDIVRGIQFSVNSSIDILERHFSNQLEKYIDSNNKFFTKTVKLNDNYAVDIPLFCMSDHNALILDEMEVRMKVDLKDFEIKEVENTCSSEIFSVSRSSFCVDANNIDSKNPNNIDICI